MRKYIKNVKLKRKMDEIFFVPPNDLGYPMITNLYRLVTSYFKTLPFLILVPISLIIVFFLYLAFGFFIVYLTNFLQYGH